MKVSLSMQLHPCDRRRPHRAGWSVCVWTFVLGVLLTAGCVPSYEARLRSHRDQGDLAAAEELLDDALRHDPRNATVVRERGIVAIERGAPADAVPLLERVLIADPDDARAAFYLATAADELRRWDEAMVRYRRFASVTEEMAPDVQALLVRQQKAVAVERMNARLEQAFAGGEPRAHRVLFLPFDLQSPTPLARSLRLGLTAILIEDWRGVPAAEAVPLDELQAFMTALGIEPDSPIDEPTRERLAILTGASHVVYGRISELGGSVTLEPRILDRLDDDPETALTRVEYLRGRVGTVLALEKTILFRTAGVIEVELTERRVEALRGFATESALALQFFGEALWLLQTDDTAEARERLDRSVSQDPDFVLAQNLRLVLDPTLPPAVAGQTLALRGAYEQRLRLAEQADLQSDMLATTTERVGMIGGPEGETADLSINRPAASGAAGVLIRLPR